MKTIEKVLEGVRKRREDALNKAYALGNAKKPLLRAEWHGASQAYRLVVDLIERELKGGSDETQTSKDVSNRDDA